MALRTNVPGGQNYPGQVNRPQYVASRVGQPQTAASQIPVPANEPIRNPDTRREEKSTYRIGDTEITEREYETFNKASDYDKFKFIMEKEIKADGKVIIPKGSQFVEGLPEDRAAEIRRISAQGAALGIVPETVESEIKASDWGYYTPEQVAEIKASQEQRAKDVQKYIEDVKLSRVEQAIADKEAIDVRLEDVVTTESRRSQLDPTKRLQLITTDAGKVVPNFNDYETEFLKNRFKNLPNISESERKEILKFMQPGKLQSSSPSTSELSDAQRKYIKAYSELLSEAYETYVQKYGRSAYAQSLVAAPLSFVFSPARALAPDVEFKDISGMEWAVGGAQVALLAVPGIGSGLSRALSPLGGKIATAAILTASGAIMTTDTVQNWKNMSPAEQKIAIAMDVLIIASAVPSLVKAANAMRTSTLQAQRLSIRAGKELRVVQKAIKSADAFTESTSYKLMGESERAEAYAVKAAKAQAAIKKYQNTLKKLENTIVSRPTATKFGKGTFKTKSPLKYIDYETARYMEKRAGIRGLASRIQSLNKAEKDLVKINTKLAKNTPKYMEEMNIYQSGSKSTTPILSREDRFIKWSKLLKKQAELQTKYKEAAQGMNDAITPQYSRLLKTAPEFTNYKLLGIDNTKYTYGVSPTKQIVKPRFGVEVKKRDNPNMPTTGEISKALTTEEWVKAKDGYYTINEWDDAAIHFGEPRKMLTSAEAKNRIMKVGEWEWADDLRPNTHSFTEGGQIDIVTHVDAKTGNITIKRLEVVPKDTPASKFDKLFGNEAKFADDFIDTEKLKFRTEKVFIDNDGKVVVNTKALNPGTKIKLLEPGMRLSGPLPGGGFRVIFPNNPTPGGGNRAKTNTQIIKENLIDPETGKTITREKIVLKPAPADVAVEEKVVVKTQPEITTEKSSDVKPDKVETVETTLAKSKTKYVEPEKRGEIIWTERQAIEAAKDAGADRIIDARGVPIPRKYIRSGNIPARYPAPYSVPIINPNKQPSKNPIITPIRQPAKIEAPNISQSKTPGKQPWDQPSKYTQANIIMSPGLRDLSQFDKKFDINQGKQSQLETQQLKQPIKAAIKLQTEKTPPEKEKIMRYIPTNLKDKSEKEKRKIIKKTRGAITWRQGELNGQSRWVVILPPYQSDEQVTNVFGRIPQGAKLVTGSRSAFKTAVASGLTPSQSIGVFRGLGAFSVQITPQGKGVSLDYTPNISRKSPRISGRMPRLR